MAIYAISDIHVKTDGVNSEVLKAFLKIPFKESDTIYFLGDIFDLLIGPHKEYYSEYNWFFDRVKALISQGTEIHYFEGNHDFHLEKLLSHLGVHLHKSPVVKEYFGRRFLFCHGDEIEIGNPSYKAYKSFVTSKPLNFIANYIMPYGLLNLIGENASKKSRKRNKNRYGNSQENTQIRDRFREAAAIASKKFDAEIIICGHSHFKDDYEWSNLRYLNCGYLPISKNYILIEEGQISFSPLSL